MPLTQIATALLCQPWGILPDAHANLARALQRHLSGDRPPTEDQLLASKQLDPQLAEWRARGEVVVGPTDREGNPLIPQMLKAGSVAVIPVFGTLGRHLSFLSLWCGGCDYSHIEQMAQLAEADPNIETIVFYFRTPGGMAVGCEECADVITGLSKATVAYSDNLCCSCGYWLACACDQILFSASSMVGNVGIFIAMLDDSEQWKANGIHRELFRSGPLKAIGISGKAWNDAERAAQQARVDSSFATFRAFVLAQRPAADESTFSGAWVHGREAAALNLADGIAPSLEAVLAAVA